MHRHAFFRAARTPQPALLRGADVEWLADLDRTNWLVLSRPTALPGREDPVAALLDGNGDGRVRVPEVLAAIDWLRPRLASFDRLFLPFAGLVPDDLRADTPEGKPLADLLAQIAPDGTPVKEADVEAFRKKTFTGLITGRAAFSLDDVEDENFHKIASLFKDLFPMDERFDGYNGNLITRDLLQHSYSTIDMWVHYMEGKPEGPYSVLEIDTICRLMPAVDRYFDQCAILRYDPSRSFEEEEKEEVLLRPHRKRHHRGISPVAQPSATATGLNLRERINPYWADITNRLADILGKDILTKEEWKQFKVSFRPHLEWLQNGWGETYYGTDLVQYDKYWDTETLSDPENLKILTDPKNREMFEKIFRASEAKAPLLDAVWGAKKLATLREGFLRFLRNFVNVADLYPPMADPLFLTGTLFMDGRCCRLCFPVEGDAAAHAKAAEGSRCCLVYCALERKGEAGRTILAVFTAGATGALTVGKRGVFFDLQGRDWEAVACHVAINAISLSEAFVEPWRRIGAACVETARKLLAGKGDAAVAALAPKPAKPAMPPEMASVATLGIALSFVASAAAAIAAAVTNAPLWKTGAVAAGVVLAVSVPSVILAWFRLRNRDLAPILNASGWAINRAIGLTPRLGRFFTRRASLVGRRFVLPSRKE